MPVSWFGVNVSVVPDCARGHGFHKGTDDATSGLKQKEMNSRQWVDSALICHLLKHYTLQHDVLCLYITLALRLLYSNKIDWLSWVDTPQKGLSLWFVWELCRLFKRDCKIVTRFNPKAGRKYLTAHCLLLCMTSAFGSFSKSLSFSLAAEFISFRAKASISPLSFLFVRSIVSLFNFLPTCALWNALPQEMQINLQWDLYFKPWQWRH